MKDSRRPGLKFRMTVLLRVLYGNADFSSSLSSHSSNLNKGPHIHAWEYPTHMSKLQPPPIQTVPLSHLLGKGAHTGRKVGGRKWEKNNFQEHRVQDRPSSDGEPEAQGRESSAPGCTAIWIAGSTVELKTPNSGLNYPSHPLWPSSVSGGRWDMEASQQRHQTCTQGQKLLLRTDPQTQLCLSVLRRPRVITLPSAAMPQHLFLQVVVRIKGKVDNNVINVC